MNTHRYIARVIVEATTPLFVGSGESSLLKDAMVQKDCHGMPMIQGTSITGVLRHAFEDHLSEGSTAKADWHDIFGAPQSDNSKGARLRVSSAYLMLTESLANEGLAEVPDNIKQYFDNLPSRQHVRIDHKGAAIKGGLFDNEVVYKGTRFKFEIELIGTEKDQEAWQQILAMFGNSVFRVGHGTRNGYGNLKVQKLHTRKFNLQDPQDFDDYLDFDPALNSLNENILAEATPAEHVENSGLIHYKLVLQPDSIFFNFSSGYADDEVDNTPLTEEVAVYKQDGLHLKKQTVLPGSSIKGAIAHRTAFHYNKAKERFANKLNTANDELRAIQIKMLTGNFNDAVHHLFGGEEGGGILSDTEKQHINDIEEYSTAASKTGQRGRVIIDDVYLTDEEVDNNEILNHVAIDRFTGGAMAGALFSEKSSRLKENKPLHINIAVQHNSSISVDDADAILQAFEEALIDICKGLLPLGGMTTKGNGIFTGSLQKNNEAIYSYGN
jgi:CRISPR/Cas system CSM-associated protein Csm3 (group 7 of RAMP superfamily)